ncbi:hypothetical protein KTR66_09665 [Roseococcus sp. SDR]|uniref:hypothetical protein n=1 Tax=Roseococcus sp. SDR TaxID=2835532 RepID=UPI001BCEA062|nr:hypothetical protein [Roseococcus sp. SDR]MBS7790263.1 hypothetical protein [Roseococcus sp. SDR]MBV1845577.1 hypothetical protein [Roseococcus sp. SDR]
MRAPDPALLKTLETAVRDAQDTWGDGGCTDADVALAVYRALREAQPAAAAVLDGRAIAYGSFLPQLPTILRNHAANPRAEYAGDARDGLRYAAEILDAFLQPLFVRPQPGPLEPEPPPFSATRLPDFLVAAMLRVLRQNISDCRPPDKIIGGEADPYMRRWYILPRSADASCYLHEFLRSDEDRALHDHPYDSVGIILAGGYIEHTDTAAPQIRLPGDVIPRRATDRHRVQLFTGPDGRPQPAWTLFATGARVRDWGFWCGETFVPWQTFEEALPGGGTRGCGE